MKKYFLIIIAMFIITSCISQELVGFNIGKCAPGDYQDFIKADSFYYQVGLIVSKNMKIGFGDESINISKTNNSNKQVYLVKYDLNYKIIWASVIDRTKNVTSARIKYYNEYIYLFWDTEVFWDTKDKDKINHYAHRIKISNPKKVEYLFHFSSGKKNTDYLVEISDKGSIGVAGTFKDYIIFPYYFQYHKIFSKGSLDTYVFSFDNIPYYHHLKKSYGYTGPTERKLFALKYDTQYNLHLFGHYEETVQLDSYAGPELIKLNSDSEYHISFNSVGEVIVFKNIANNTFSLKSRTLKLNNGKEGYVSIRYYKSNDNPFKFVFLDTSLNVISIVPLAFSGENRIIDMKVIDSSISLLVRIDRNDNLEILNSNYRTKDSDYAIINLDFNGNVNWYNYFGADSDKGTEPLSLNYLDNGNYIIAARTFGDIDIDPTRKKVKIPYSSLSFYVSEYNNVCNGLIINLESKIDISCNKYGSINFSATGGTKPLEFLFENKSVEINDTIPITVSGIYEGILIDDSGCSKSIYVPVSGPKDENENSFQLLLHSSDFRSGFTEQISIELKNETCLPKTGIIEIVLDKNLEYLDASVQPFEINDQTILFKYNSLVFEKKKFKVRIKVRINSQVQFGNQICFPVNIYDQNKIRVKNKIICKEVINSFDPNDIAVAPYGRCPENYFLKSEFLEYYLRFQNIGNAEAINILVVDTLDSSLDISTLEVLNSSHSFNAFVEEDSILIFEFNSINLPSESQDSLASNGSIVYKIKALDNIPIGKQIKNNASIYFDFNDPIVTNKVKSTLIDYLPNCIITKSNEVTAITKIFPNPVTSILNIEFNDNAEHKVSLYNIYGKIILRNIVQSGTKLSIDLSNDDSGVYFIKIDNIIHKILKI